MYSAVTGWMASLTVTFRTSAEEKVAKRKSTARQQAEWRVQSWGGHRQLPSFARLGRAGAPVPTLARRLKPPVILCPLRCGGSRGPSKLMRFMAVAAAALSPRAWLLGCASGFGRRDCRVPVAAPD